MLGCWCSTSVCLSVCHIGAPYSKGWISPAVLLPSHLAQSYGKRMKIFTTAFPGGGERVWQIMIFEQYQQMIQDIAILTMPWKANRTRIQSVSWCHLQWPWVTPNLNFKVTVFFSVKYLENGTGQSCTYNAVLIGSPIHVSSIEFFHSHWPEWLNNAGFKDMQLCYFFSIW